MNQINTNNDCTVAATPLLPFFHSVYSKLIKHVLTFLMALGCNMYCATQADPTQTPKIKIIQNAPGIHGGLFIELRRISSYIPFDIGLECTIGEAFKATNTLYLDNKKAENDIQKLMHSMRTLFISPKMYALIHVSNKISLQLGTDFNMVSSIIYTHDNKQVNKFDLSALKLCVFHRIGVLYNLKQHISAGIFASLCTAKEDDVLCATSRTLKLDFAVKIGMQLNDKIKIGGCISAGYQRMSATTE